LQAETTDITLKVESLFTTSLHLSDFVQTQNKAKILTIWSFLKLILSLSHFDFWFYRLREIRNILSLSEDQLQLLQHLGFVVLSIPTPSKYSTYCPNQFSACILLEPQHLTPPMPATP